MSTTLGTSLKKSKYNGRSKKRKWEERRSDKGAGLYAGKKIAQEKDENFVRIKRRKYALLLGYSGVDYYGMQRNPTMKTIEEDLFGALLKAELITQDAFEQIQTIQFQRAARTDKGVSAARQVVSIKLPEEVDLSKANAYLPEQIKIFGIKRVTKGFNSKSQCDGRTYTYLLPTVAFCKSDEEMNPEAFRLSADALTEINNLLQLFKGTKNYHNFTCKKKPTDPSARRYMMSFDCESPIIRNGVEFAVLKVKGQSFMLHQIRKMVGLSLAVIKGYTGKDTFNKAWTLEKLNIPKAPGLGLVLDQVHYDRYNHRYGKDGIHETLDWIECDADVDEFKEKHIYPTIIDTEIKERNIISWLESRLVTHNFYQVEEESQASDGEHSSDDDVDEKEVDVNPANDKKDVRDNLSSADVHTELSSEQKI